MRGVSEPLSQRQALLVLNALPHIGPVVLRRLMDAFGGDAPAILAAGEDRLRTVPGVGEKVAGCFRDWRRHVDLGREESLVEKNGVRFIVWDDPAYPPLLKETYDPPIGLYWKGNYTVDRPCVALVGTRRATLYGRSVARRFAAELAGLGFCVVSGMARGTDAAAHEGALEAGGRTVAVLGCGLDIVYPAENIDLYRRLAAEGAVASEFPFGRRADRQSFPMRNRVVAGMCEGVVVVESDDAGGSMITARFAGEQGRQLFAVPGRIDQASSRGCHQLIRDGAVLVRSVDDILEELRYRRPVEQELPLSPGRPEDRGPPLPEAERAVLDCFEGGEILAPDAVAERLAKPSGEVAALLMSLELARRVVKRSDGRFEATS